MIKSGKRAKQTFSFPSNSILNSFSFGSFHSLFGESVSGKLDAEGPAVIEAMAKDICPKDQNRTNDQVDSPNKGPLHHIEDIPFFVVLGELIELAWAMDDDTESDTDVEEHEWEKSSDREESVSKV